MNVETLFNDLGVNAIKGSEVLEMFGLSIDDLNIPQTFVKLQSVIKYLGQFPEDTQRFLVNKATRGKPVDKIGHMFEYTMILKEKEQNEKLLGDVNKELSAINGDLSKTVDLQTKKAVIDTNLARLGEELNIFNK